jgi:hypothetical protein
MRYLASLARDQATGQAAIEFATLATFIMRSQGDPVMALRMAEAARLPRIMSILKSAVTAGSLGDASWAAKLADYRGLSDSFASSLANIGVFDFALSSGAVVIPENVSISIVTVAPTAANVAEGKVKPISRASLSGLSLIKDKASTIVAVSEELLRSTALAARLLGNELRTATALGTDRVFLSAMIAGIAPLTSAGSSPIGIADDLSSMLEAVETDASGSNLTFESQRGFPLASAHANLAHAHRNFHQSYAL